jgi:HAMP domain-containing protein
LEEKKSLKAKIAVVVVLTIIGFWVISAVLAQKHAESFWVKLERHVQEHGMQGEVLDELRQEKRSLFRELASIRLLGAAFAVVTLSITVAVILRRRVLRPISLLSDRIHKMRLGTWDHPIPLEQDDEMGGLVREFNELGPELAFTAHQYAAASKLAAMALIGQRVVRRTMHARQRLLGVAEALARLPVDEKSQGIAIEQVRLVAGELETVAADFDSEFQAELTRVGSSPGTTGGRRAA